MPKSYSDVIKHTISTSSSSPTTTPTSTSRSTSISSTSRSTSISSTCSSTLPSQTPTAARARLSPIVSPSSLSPSTCSTPAQEPAAQANWRDFIPGILNDSKNFTNGDILANLRRAAEILNQETGLDYWITDEGQSELLRRVQSESQPPTSAGNRSPVTSTWGSSTGVDSPTLSPLNYTQRSMDMMGKATLSPCSPAEE